MPSSSNNKRIAKNTIFLYSRMIVVMLVSLYTSRIVLELLGEADYGIYNIVGGVVIMVAFIRNSMSNAIQRYMSFSLGKKDDKISSILGNSIIAYLLLTIFILILAETVGLWFVNHKLNIPNGSMFATNIVYQLSILAFIINVFRVPFEATVISFEKMSFYAYLSIIETVLNLGVVFLLMILGGNKLINYSVLMVIVPFGTNLAFQIYVRKKLNCRVTFAYDKGLLKELFSYSGWSMLGSIANIFASQGGNILINMFFGVTLNAAFGLAAKVNASISSLVSSFQTAFRPQIVKLYANNDTLELFSLCMKTSKFSYYILLLLILPISVNINLLLGLWLTEVPPYTGMFCILFLIYSLIDAIQSPITYLITATGKIKVYEIWLSSLLFLNIPISYIFLKLDYPPITVLIIYVSINFVTAIIRTIYAKGFVGFPSNRYLNDVIKPTVLVTIISIILCNLINNIIATSIISSILAMVIEFIGITGIVYGCGLSQSEREFMRLKISKLLRIKS